eukprot:3895186-Pleurochrysis_carterae.AAC.2
MLLFGFASHAYLRIARASLSKFWDPVARMADKADSANDPEILRRCVNPSLPASAPLTALDCIAYTYRWLCDSPPGPDGYSDNP